MNETEDRYKIISEDYKEFISERNELSAERFPQTGEVQIKYNEEDSVVYVKGEFSDKDFYELPYYSIPQVYSIQAEEYADNMSGKKGYDYPGSRLTGENVIVGFIDTGIQYTEEMFRNLDGTTRILCIWDQTEQSGRCPERFPYGSEYTKADIDRALMEKNPYQRVPSIDKDGHGTYMASVAVGGAVVEENFMGIAPEAEIAVVKLKPAKACLKQFWGIREDSVCYQETDILMAVSYLNQLSEKERKPLVLCLPFGTNMGGHTGSSPLSTYMDRVGRTSFRALVTGTGNEADKRHHFKGEILGQDGEEMEISVSGKEKSFCMEIWIDVPDVFSVSVTSPTGETITNIPVWEQKKEYELIFERTKVDIVYRILVRNTNSELIFLKFKEPVAGIWSIKVEPVNLISGQFHAWLPLKEFTESSVVFLRAEPDGTITSPGNTEAVTSVAFYDGQENSIAVNSGRGYTRNKLIKPDFSAPGINIRGVDRRGNPIYRSGSDAAVSITVGVEALLMEWLAVQGVKPDARQITNLLILGAWRGTGFLYPNTKWGYGRLDLSHTFEQIRRL